MAHDINRYSASASTSRLAPRLSREQITRYQAEQALQQWAVLRTRTENRAEALSNINAFRSGPAYRAGSKLVLKGFGLKALPPHLDILLPDLQQLDISDNPLTTLEGVCKFNELRTLTAKNISLSELTDNLPASLETLDLSDNQLNSAQKLSHLSYLQSLVLDKNRIESLADLPTGHALRCLSLQNNHLTAVASMPELSGLSDLDLSHNSLRSLSGIPALKNLNSLDISGNPVSRGLLELNSLQHVPGLFELRANSCNLSSLEGIEGFDKLRYLEIRNNNLMNLNELNSLPLLNALYTIGNKLPDDILNQLSESLRARLEIHELGSQRNQATLAVPYSTFSGESSRIFTPTPISTPQGYHTGSPVADSTIVTSDETDPQDDANLVHPSTVDHDNFRAVMRFLEQNNASSEEDDEGAVSDTANAFDGSPVHAEGQRYEQRYRGSIRDISQLNRSESASEISHYSSSPEIVRDVQFLNIYRGGARHIHLPNRQASPGRSEEPSLPSSPETVGGAGFLTRHQGNIRDISQLNRHGSPVRTEEPSLPSSPETVGGARFFSQYQGDIRNINQLNRSVSPASSEDRIQSPELNNASENWYIHSHSPDIVDYHNIPYDDPASDIRLSLQSPDQSEIMGSSHSSGDIRSELSPVSEEASLFHDVCKDIISDAAKRWRIEHFNNTQVLRQSFKAQKYITATFSPEFFARLESTLGSGKNFIMLGAGLFFTAEGLSESGNNNITQRLKNNIGYLEKNADDTELLWDASYLVDAAVGTCADQVSEGEQVLHELIDNRRIATESQSAKEIWQRLKSNFEPYRLRIFADDLVKEKYGDKVKEENLEFYLSLMLQTKQHYPELLRQDQREKSLYGWMYDNLTGKHVDEAGKLLSTFEQDDPIWNNWLAGNYAVKILLKKIFVSDYKDMGSHRAILGEIGYGTKDEKTADVSADDKEFTDALNFAYKNAPPSAGDITGALLKSKSLAMEQEWYQQHVDKLLAKPELIDNLFLTKNDYDSSI